MHNNKLRPSETQLGHLQRIFKSVAVDSSDTFAYCGTTSGDVLQVGSACVCASRAPRLR